MAVDTEKCLLTERAGKEIGQERFVAGSFSFVVPSGSELCRLLVAYTIFLGRMLMQSFILNTAQLTVILSRSAAVR